MRPGRVLAVTRKTLHALRHDPRTVALMMLAPIMAMLIFGFAFGSQTHDVRTIVVNHDGSGFADAIVGHLDAGKLRLENGTDDEVARQAVRDGHATAALIFPASFSQGGHAEVFLDTTQSQLSAAVLQSLADSLQKVARERGVSAPVAFDPAYAYPAAKDARFIDGFVPGIMAFAVTLFTTLLTLLAFVGERVNGTLDRLRATPVTEAEIVLGYELAFGLVAAVQATLLLTTALLLYHVLIVGPIAVALLLVSLTAIDAQAIGILISAAAQREGQAVQMIPFIILPVFLLSGIFVPVESLPAWLSPLSYLLPPTWAIQGLRDVMLRGWGLEHVWLHATVLVGFGLLFSGAAILALRRARNA
ncbi:MAG: type transport system permease protein [Thermoplasmata archaeon]|nr:type transport system permease protein [Thermoplasmata archaeon]